MKTVMGIFPSLPKADEAFTKLIDAGFDKTKISAISKDNSVVTTEQKGTVQNVASGVTSGAVAGGAIGGLAGILVAAGTITLPGIGALLIGGPLVTALGLSGAAATAATGAITGAAAGGIIGALTGLGMPAETAQVYEKRISEGGVALSVDTEDADTPKVQEILNTNGAEEVVAISGS